MKLKKLFILMVLVMIPFGIWAENPSAWLPVKAMTIEDDTNSVLSRTVHSTNDSISVDYKLPMVEFDPIPTVSIGEDVGELCRIGNSLLKSDEGKPVIPYIRSQIIIPSGYSIDEIDIVPEEVKELPTKHTLIYGEKPHPLSSEYVEWASPNAEVYQSDDPYPGKNVEVVDVQYYCGVAVAEVNIYPLSYKPLSGTITYYDSFSMNLSTKIDGAQGSGVRVDLNRIREAGLFAENPEALNSYIDGTISGDYENSLASSTESYDWVLITSNEIINSNVNPGVNELVSLRQSKNLSCKVQSIEEVLNSYTGSNKADKLRNFIKDAYNNWNIKFVVLGGDSNIIPVRTVYASYGSTSDYLPTDLPYQCLDKNTWNNDYAGEVLIGRISAETPQEFSNQVYKIISYENTPSNDTFRKSILGLGEKMDSRTYAKQAILKVESIFSQDYRRDGLYDQQRTWSKSELINKINTNNYSIINHLGHSNTNYAMKLMNGDETRMSNNKFSFAKSQGCIPGAFDRDCMAEHLTTSNRSGMFAVVFNSRYGWYMPGNILNGSSQILHTDFWEAYFRQDLKYLGALNEYSHRMNTRYRWDILESNLFGDPATEINGIEGVVIPPGTPRNLLSSNITSETAVLSWDRVSNARDYTIQTLINNQWIVLATTNNLSYETVGHPGEEVTWRVRANNSAGSSGYSTGVTFKFKDSVNLPTIPRNLNHSNLTSTSVTGSWDSANNAESYTVQQWWWGKWNTLGTVAGTSYNFTEQPGQIVYWRVKSNNESGSSEYCDWVSVELLSEDTKPEVPQNLRHGNYGRRLVWGEWDHVDGADYYTVQQWIDGRWQVIGETTGWYYKITGYPGNYVYWRVRANNDSGSSDYSPWVSKKLRN